MNADILTTYSLNALESKASLAGLTAKGRTLKEATVNVFRLLPRCQDYTEQNIRELLQQHPESYGKTLLENVMGKEC